MVKVFLVRHGESEANVACQISDDPGRLVNLTERGAEQAVATAKKLQSVRFHHAYVSQFPRAQQTVEILLQFQNCALSIDARINERRSGMDGLPVHLFNDQVRRDPLYFSTERGESFIEQMDRVRSFLDALAERHDGQTILAVSHENPIVAALALTVAEPAEVVFNNIANCGWIELDWPGR